MSAACAEKRLPAPDTSRYPYFVSQAIRLFFFFGKEETRRQCHLDPADKRVPDGAHAQYAFGADESTSKRA